eukprot:TRINITY_DN387_c0_g3_i1.p1 TRINITY_DN387_c0_g3~~TRINITY_DN387_c0_g3_i1.p1  ORF type:complete len:381 (-),score=72.83 TRINITY_DN387_c0_g3_i1:72-1214(-)
MGSLLSWIPFVGSYFGSSSDKTCDVVILGGGVVGICAAKDLDGHPNIRVTLVERNPQFYHILCSPRAIVDNKFAQTSAFFSYKNLLKRGKIIHAAVKEVTPSEVIFEGETENLRFDYLILATGSSWTSPFQVNGMMSPELLLEISNEIKQAEKVLIVGAGPVGVEVAGEIAHFCPGKRVVLVSTGNWLGSKTIQGKFQTSLRNQLEAMGVEIIFGERVVIPGDVQTDAVPKVQKRTYMTENGREIEADLLLLCTGGKPNTKICLPHFADKMDAQGRLRVDQFLRIEGYENIFAAGDINDVSELKQALTGRSQERNVTANIKKMINGKPMAPYKMYSPVVILTLGPKGGVGQIFGYHLGPWFVSLQAGGYHVQQVRWMLKA